MKKYLILSFFLLFWFVSESQNQQKHNDSVQTFMFYNVENLFDCKDDSLTNDNEFSPGGVRNWNDQKLHHKANHIAKVILAAGKWNPPVFVGLCEVENQNVLDLLIRDPALISFGYKSIHKDSPDERGIDVAFLYRPEIYRPFKYQTFPVVDTSDPAYKTREILLVSGVFNACDTLDIFINHWPSRYGGIVETRKYRKIASTILQDAIEELRRIRPHAKIICTGDFNDTPLDESIEMLTGSDSRIKPLINLSARWISDPVKTIKNQYTWEIFDQWIVSDNFRNSDRCFKFLEAKVLNLPFLLKPDEKFGGMKPRRTYEGYTYQEDGFSDHLPIVLQVELLNH